uniref:Uncharacterized protein n=1 Tax=Arundo donax TaxID=35708 RepID=A0A0A9CJ77_ARUDO
MISPKSSGSSSLMSALCILSFLPFL